MQQQVSELRPLLYQVQPGHALRLAFKLRRGNANELTQYVPRIIERECLVKVTRKKIPLQKLVAHMVIRFKEGAKWPINNIDGSDYQSDKGTVALAPLLNASHS